MINQDALFIRRCLDLAELGAGKVSPNPKVGAVIVYQNRIIGEGFHQQYGKAHAEVNAVNSVKEIDRPYLPQSTIYINLEPCCIHGNTPPCTDLIIKYKIPRVIFANIDSTAGVKGNSIKILEAAGCEVLTGVEVLTSERMIAPETGNRPLICKNRWSSVGMKIFYPDDLARRRCSGIFGAF